jgi:ankyrin repeat protein
MPGVDYMKKIIGDIECHSVEGIKECFANGIDANAHFNNEPLFNELTSEYGRTPRFKDCVKAFMEAGLEFEDKALLAVLGDDVDTLETYLRTNPDLVQKKYSLRCAFTPLYEATLLHISAEFNHLSCGELLVRYGADINAKAGFDEYGFGGQTPIFHTVNQNLDNSKDMMQFLLSKSADLQITVRGLIWGRSYPWETLIPSVNPISYAMMGNLPQMHRNEKRIAAIVAMLLKTAYGIDYIPRNIPNAYLK